jgi:RHS repeat-associated protein
MRAARASTHLGEVGRPQRRRREDGPVRGNPCGPPASDALSIARSPSNGLVNSITLGSVTESFGYNDYGELASQTSTFGATPLLTLTYDTPAFGRDALGRLTRKTETIAGVTTTFDYAYNALGRLTDVAKNGILEEHFEYDSNGNRTLAINATLGTSHTGTYDDQDRLLSYGPSAFTYTPNGELATRTQTSSGQTWTYTYDALGNLLTVAIPGGPTITYLVDGQNRRVGKRVAGTLVKQWLYKDGLRPVAELNGSGAVVTRFVYGSDRNVPDYVVRGGNTYRVLADQLGSPRMAVNVANQSDVPFRADYSSFGVHTMLEGAADWIPFGFAGGMYDADTGLVRFGARDYEPTLGRWVSKDPSQFGGDGPNLYEYALSDPANYADHTGRTAIPLSPPIRLPPGFLPGAGVIAGAIGVGAIASHNADAAKDIACKIGDLPNGSLPLPRIADNDNGIPPAVPVPIPKHGDPNGKCTEGLKDCFMSRISNEICQSCNDRCRAEGGSRWPSHDWNLNECR